MHRILHPTDFEDGSEPAFAHALRIALAARAQLTLLHVDEPSAPADWEDFPHVRSLLERWGELPAGSHRSDVVATGVDVRKVLATPGDRVERILRYVEDHGPNLIVLSTHQRHGLERLLHAAVAAPVARLSNGRTLFVPRAGRRFVSAADGSVRLRKILVPVDSSPHPQPAADAVVELLDLFGWHATKIMLLHVGAGPAPSVSLPHHEGLSIDRLFDTGDVVERILATATEREADLIAMATEGHTGFLDALRGSTTERVVRDAQCPVLAAFE